MSTFYPIFVAFLGINFQIVNRIKYQKNILVRMDSILQTGQKTAKAVEVW